MPSAPELPFTMIEEEFQALGRPPNALRIACAAFSAALPPGPLSPNELRETLLQKTTAFETRDEALAWVMGMAQTDGDRWMMAALGMLLPGLRSQTAYLTAWCPALAADVQAEVLDATVVAIVGLHPGQTRIAAGLVWAGYRGGHRYVTGQLTEETRRASSECIRTEAPGGHPDLVLYRAVSEGVIEACDAAIIGDTRLGDVRLTGLADVKSKAYQSLAKRRRRAEIRLAAWLGEQVA